MATVSCGGAGASVRSENTQLRDEVSQLRVRARTDRRRIRDLTNEVLKLKGRLAEITREEASESVGPGAVPPLPVKVVTPPAAAADDAAAGDDEDTGDEPDVILLTNLPRHPSAAPARRARPVPRAEDRLPVTSGRVPTVAAAAAAAPVHRTAVHTETSPEADARGPQAAYKRYLAALFAGNHAYAIAGFTHFIARNPTHKYADNAQYWLGEAHYDQHDYKAAEAAFRAVIEHYPRGNKVAAARLKIGYCRLKLGDGQGAQKAFAEVIAEHPESAPARLAREQLKQLEDRR